MPTYEYACEKCKKSFEAVQPMAADALTVCPKDKCCLKKWGKGKVKRMIGAGAGLIFKGSGFYITDYRSEGYKADAKKDSSASSSAPASESKAKTESKAAAHKPEPKKSSESKSASSKPKSS